ncbi:ParB/RepB/Spo0J family partition protein [Okeania sp. SIO2B3]|uniref:ParB/RepB/Spo0J family partition protein n=1 Tax=Okeania sp. SIO2B3 TaxID=2607784 RepID=UPI0025EA7D0C|nr:ParB/RepB/Spo0J family partition protein [Okeania sp. SIO2B3]
MSTTSLQSTTGQQEISIEEIVLPPSQPRRYFDPEKLAQLSASISQFGVLEPLLVRPTNNNLYELVAGERRLRASKMAGLTSVPVIIRSLNDEDAWQLSLIENLLREDLNPLEETEGILQLLAVQIDESIPSVVKLLNRMQNEVKGKVTPNVMGSPTAQIIESVFEDLGLMNWQSFVKNRLPLLKLPPDILEVLRSGELDYTKAVAIAKVKDEAMRQSLLEEVIEKSLSLSGIRQKVAEINQTVKQEDTLKSGLDNTYRLIKSSRIWDNTKKRRQLEKLLVQIEKLVSGE